MKYLLKCLGFYAIFLVLLVFICSLLNLIGVNSSITNLMIFLFNVAAFLFFGIKAGSKASSKGYIAGLKISGLFLLLLFIINLFTLDKIFKLSTIIYYLILLLVGTFGGMLGINKKANDVN